MRRPTAEQLDEWWAQRHHPSPVGRTARDRLIEHYLPLVRREVDRYSAGLPRHVDRDEFLSDGMFGLIDAVDRFDETRGSRFPTFAEKRIRGAIMEGERSKDRASRRFRDQADRLTAAQSRLTGTLGRTPTEEEIAGELGIGVEDLRSLLSRAVAASRPTSGDDLAFERLEAGAPVEDAVTKGEWAEGVRWAVADAIGVLDERSRMILALYYFAAHGCDQHERVAPGCGACGQVEERGLTLQEIADLLGMSRAWASSVHSDALRALREALTNRREPVRG